MNGQCEWTESGELLLKMIDACVKTNGGCARMADIVIMESPEYFPVEEVNAARRRLNKHELNNILIRKSSAFEIGAPVIDRKSAEYFSQFKWSGRTRVDNSVKYNEYGFIQILPKRPELSTGDNF